MKLKSLTLIGMPGVGKTAIGKALSKSLGYDFLDTDQALARQLDSTLQHFIDKYGHNNFLREEEQYLCKIKLKNRTIISTGGSAIYSELGMANLQSFSTIIYLEDDINNIKNRIRNLETRGIVNLKNNDLDSLFNERIPLYEEYQTIKIQVHPFNKAKIVGMITEELNKRDLL